MTKFDSNWAEIKDMPRASNEAKSWQTEVTITKTNAHNGLDLSKNVGIVVNKTKLNKTMSSHNTPEPPRQELKKVPQSKQ